MENIIDGARVSICRIQKHFPPLQLLLDLHHGLLAGRRPMPGYTERNPAGEQRTESRSPSPRAGSDLKLDATSNSKAVDEQRQGSAEEPLEKAERVESQNDLREQCLSCATTPRSSSPSPPSSCSTQQTTSKSTPVAWRRSLRRIVSVLNLVSKDNDELQREEQRKTRDVDMYLNRPQICRLPLKTLSSLCVSFSGCGFLGSYHFGAVDCLLKNGQHIISRLDRTSGASAGSLVASLLLLAPQHSKRACKVLFELGDELSTLRFGALTPGYCLNEKLIKIVDTFLPIDISPAQGRLFISLTKQKERTNYMVSRYSSREHLIQCLLASCYIPLYSSGYAGEAPVVDGFSCFDGGYTNNLPDFEDIRTITISPFSGFAEISPLDENYFDWKMTVSNQIMNVNLQNIVRGAQALFPPSLDVIENYYELGFKDTFRFLMKNDILQREEGTAV